MIKTSKELQEILNTEKKDKEEKVENLENLDKQIDRVVEKKKKEQDEIDKQKLAKAELQDKYYGQMIDYTKYQYLVNDIKWMKEMKAKLQESEDRKQKIIQEKKEWAEKIAKEKEERKQKELERKQKEEERRLREIARKEEREANLRNEELNEFKKLNDALIDESVGSNPLFDHIEQCEFLKRYCQK